MAIKTTRKTRAPANMKRASIGKDKDALPSAPATTGGQRRARVVRAAEKRVRLTRLEARVPEPLNNKILKAASIKGTTKTDFLLFALDEVASRVILEESTLQLHIDDQKALAAAILADKPHPPARKMSSLRKYGEEYAKRVEQK